MTDSRFTFRRRHYYLIATGIGFTWGLVVGIANRNCSHPAQPPFFQCLAEDPIDVLFPLVYLTALVLLAVGLLDLVYLTFRKLEWPTLAMMVLGGLLAGWWVLAVDELCSVEEGPMDTVSTCYPYAEWPGAIMPIALAVLVFGLLGKSGTYVLRRSNQKAPSLEHADHG